MVSLDDFRTAMKPLVRRFKQEAPDTAEDWNDYYQLMRHLAPDVLAAAVLKVMASHVYPTFPKPAVILDAAASITATLRRPGAEAWGDVLRAVAAHGYLHPPGDGWQFRDRLVEQVVGGLTWQAICESEDEMVMRAHFIKAYEQVRDREYEAAHELPAVAEVRARLAAGRVAQLTAGIGKG